MEKLIHQPVGTFVIDIHDVYTSFQTFLKELNIPYDSIEHILKNITYEVFDDIESDELSYMHRLSVKPNLTYYESFIIHLPQVVLDQFIKLSKTYILEVYSRIVSYTKPRLLVSDFVRYEYNLVDVRDDILVFTIYSIPTNV